LSGRKVHSGWPASINSSDSVGRAPPSANSAKNSVRKTAETASARHTHFSVNVSAHLLFRPWENSGQLYCPLLKHEIVDGPCNLHRLVSMPVYGYFHHRHSSLKTSSFSLMTLRKSNRKFKPAAIRSHVSDRLFTKGAKQHEDRNLPAPNASGPPRDTSSQRANCRSPTDQAQTAANKIRHGTEAT
jgi:hypothetical protein